MSSGTSAATASGVELTRARRRFSISSAARLKRWACRPSIEIHDTLGNDDHVVVLGTASATAPDGSSAEWKYVQIFHIKDGKATEVWGMAENDAAVDPFLDGIPG
jgi:predicted SnoaL-like aldol condensation-catalyzing enzyme